MPPGPIPPLEPTSASSSSVVDLAHHPMHSSSLNNNNNMVSAGPSPSSSISPLHCNATATDIIPHTTSVATLAAAAAAAAASSMASIEAIGFIDQSKLEKGSASNGEGSPKYISL